jgi:hypothetical protein
LILITVAAPVGWGRKAFGMSAASFGMADMGGSGTGTEQVGWTRAGKKLCFYRWGRRALAVRAPLSAEGVIET